MNKAKVKEYFVNNNKILLYQDNPTLFEKIDFDNDDLFLEPLLFAYFNSKKYNEYYPEMLIEILQGYFINEESLILEKSYNNNGIAYVPSKGYFKDSKLVEPILKIGDFEILKEIHPLLERYFVEFYKGHTVTKHPQFQSVWKEHYKDLENAIEIIKKYLPEFYQNFKFSNKCIYLHDNPKITNFTTIESLGMLYFYVIGTNNLIYFIEEIIHQASHNYLCYKIINKNEFFKMDVSTTIMKDLTKQEWDFYRTVFDAFHGLYTVSKRVECFDILLSKKVFSGKEKHELLGRLTDQFYRFRTGLETLNFNEVYTTKGLKLYKKLDSDCENTLKKYSKLLNYFDLSNGDIDFRYDAFCKLNSFDDFEKNDSDGVFDF